MTWTINSTGKLNIYLSVLNDKSFKIKVISRPLKLAGKNRWKRIAWSMETDTWLGVCHSNSKSIPTMQYGPAADDTKWGFKSSQGYLKLDIFFSGLTIPNLVKRKEIISMDHFKEKCLSSHRRNLTADWLIEETFLYKLFGWSK